MLALEQSKKLLFNKESSWKTSSVVVVKFNVDAVVLKDFTILAVVAWYGDGEAIEAWAKVYEICESVRAKAATILWALQLAKSENLEYLSKGWYKKLCWCS